MDSNTLLSAIGSSFVKNLMGPAQMGQQQHMGQQQPMGFMPGMMPPGPPMFNSMMQPQQFPQQQQFQYRQQTSQIDWCYRVPSVRLG